MTDSLTSRRGTASSYGAAARRDPSARGRRLSVRASTRRSILSCAPFSRGAAKRGRPELPPSCSTSRGVAEGQLRLGTRRCRVNRTSLLSFVAKPPWTCSPA
jgi:hypothetical protein